MSENFIPSLADPKDNRSPLVRFRGVLKEYKTEQNQATENRRASTRIVFNFTDVEVIESTDPYPFPIATISLTYSERADTIWDAWRKSVVKLVPSRDINELVGKQQEWHFTTAKVRRQNTEKEGSPWEVMDADAWQIVALEGVSAAGAGANLTQTLIELAVGKTDEQFYQELFTRADLKKLPGFGDAIEQASNRTLLSNFETAKMLKKEVTGVWSKGENAN